MSVSSCICFGGWHYDKEQKHGEGRYCTGDKDRASVSRETGVGDAGLEERGEFEREQVRERERIREERVRSREGAEKEEGRNRLSDVRPFSREPMTHARRHRTCGLPFHGARFLRGIVRTTETEAESEIGERRSASPHRPDYAFPPHPDDL